MDSVGGVTRSKLLINTAALVMVEKSNRSIAKPSAKMLAWFSV